MVLDTSAVAAILLREPDEGVYSAALIQDSDRLLSAASLLEASIVLEARLGPRGAQGLDRFVSELSIEVVPVTREQAEIARNCFRRFGKGKHRAALNFGDCFSYALARTSNEPLLFKGRDFLLTDIRAVDLTPYRS